MDKQFPPEIIVTGVHVNLMEVSAVARELAVSSPNLACSTKTILSLKLRNFRYLRQKEFRIIKAGDDYDFVDFVAHIINKL